MAKKKKGRGKRQSDFLQREEVLQAVVLADSFYNRFTPISHETPKMLLPLVNVPMLNYTLEFLVNNDVREIFLLCCAHKQQIEKFMADSDWFNQSRVTIQIVKLEGVYGTGDALRHLHQMDVIVSNPFVLISGDVVASMKLGPVIKAHKERVDQDSTNIMTCVFKKAAPTHRTRSLDEDMVLAVSAQTNQLLTYENSRQNDSISFDVSLFEEHTDVSFHYDLMDCYIDICSPHVLELFSDNFDYQDLRHHFIRGVLESNDVLNVKINCHIVSRDYAARVKDLRTYDSVSKDIIQRWAYPICPDNNIIGDNTYEYIRNNIYREEGVKTARSVSLGPNTVIGGGTDIGENTYIDECVIGSNCKIGSNVTLKCSYLWKDCVIGDNCQIESAILCNNVVVSDGVRIDPGAVLSHGVKIGKNHHVKPYTLLTTYQDVDDDWDAPDGTTSKAPQSWNPKHVGPGGIGRHYVIPVVDEDEKNGDGEGLCHPLLNSIKPNFDVLAKRDDVSYLVQSDEEEDDDHKEYISEDMTVEDLREKLNELEKELSELVKQQSYVASAKLQPIINKIRSEIQIRASELYASNGAAKDGADQTEDDNRFLSEVCDTIRRGEMDNLEVDYIQMETKGLKLSHNIGDISEFSSAVLIAIFLCITPQPSPTQKVDKAMLGSLLKLFKKWSPILKRFSKEDLDQLKTIQGLEIACQFLDGYKIFFKYILKGLYDEEIVLEEPILEWYESRQNCQLTTPQQFFVTQAKVFVEWLENASSEEDDDEETDEEEDSEG